ncbi:MAG: hypothetical protein HOG25_06700 [Gammaproteobacteria bacterium]|nr:hypothetical protein [Gammaproteobacteria bacterium]
MKTITINSNSYIFRIIASTTLGLIVLLDAQAEAKLVSHTPTTKTSAVVTIDHANSQMKSLEPSVLNDQYLIRETPTQTVVGSADVTEFDYDHCHFNESHQHHHCYEAEEHTHEESSADTNYRASRPTRRYYTPTNHHRSYRHSAYEHASGRYAEHKRRDNWNAIVLGLAIGLPLAYSHNHLDRGRYGSRDRGHRNGSYHSRGYHGQGYDKRGHRHRGNPHGGGNRRDRH